MVDHCCPVCDCWFAATSRCADTVRERLAALPPLTRWALFRSVANEEPWGRNADAAELCTDCLTRELEWLNVDA